MAIPVALLYGTAKVATITGGSVEKVKKNFIRFGYAIIPLDLAGHLAHNLFHIITEGKAIWYNSAALFGMNVTRGDLAFAPASSVQILQYIIIVIGMVGSIYTAYRIGNKGSFKALAPYYVLMVLLAVANIYLFSLPMMHRV
ncbi:hypothetical protein V7139_19685 [Neobacillus drentensis]|uniref:hypothetical protein n=1 Tax=Neobacillus drentensis TaxID=220684 RepID=UPI00300398BC